MYGVPLNLYKWIILNYNIFMGIYWNYNFWWAFIEILTFLFESKEIIYSIYN